jgi:hypothetical protein
LLRNREFDPDELQHLHAAWSFQNGLLPFRDFFEHHMPGIYYLLAPVIHAYDTAHDFGAVLSVILLARTLMWIFAAATIAFTVLLGRKYRSPEVGWLAGALLSLGVVFIGKTVEIRPDVPALALWSASTWALVSGADGGHRRTWWALSGLLFGGALLFTQKALLAGPGFALFAFVYLFGDEISPRLVLAKCIDLATLAICIAIPLSLVVAHYWWQGATRFLIDGTLRSNLGWIQETTAGTTLHWMLLRDPIACALAVGGGVYAFFEFLAERRNRVMHAALLAPAASLFAGMAVMPAPYPQYLLLVMPAAAVCAANGLWRSLSRDSAAMRLDGLAKAIAMIAFSVTALIGLSVARPIYRSPVVYPLVGITLLGVMIFFARLRRADYACLTVLAGVAILTAQQLVWMAGLSNREALEEMRFIHQESSPADTVMDGFSGFGWFRPHASFYWFTSPGVRARLSTAQKSSFVIELADCANAPKFVILDGHLHKLSSDIDQVVSANYRETRYPTIWLRKASHDNCRS